MSILILIILGAAAGFIATRMMGLDTNVVVTIAIGVAGVFVGGFLLRVIFAMLGATAGFVSGIVGTILLIWFYQRYRKP
jgi:uncharacterized membrane protein YeaQ/YmgE (transglycosylase-associated protein family)